MFRIATACTDSDGFCSRIKSLHADLYTSISQSEGVHTELSNETPRRATTDSAVAPVASPVCVAFVTLAVLVAISLSIVSRSTA